MTGRASSDRPTLREVAKLAGVSPGLASLALRGRSGPSAETSERVLRVAAELGYRPDAAARVLSLARSRLIGVTYDLGHPFHAEVVEQLYRCASAAGYDLALSGVTGERTPKHAAESLMDGRCEAVILLGTTERTSWLPDVVASLPVVVIGRPATTLPTDVVRTAGDDGVRQAVQHLLELGHTQIVHVEGGPTPSAAERRSAYTAAMRAERLTPDVVPGGDTEAAGATAAQSLLHRDRLPTAVLAYNDGCAVGLLDSFIRAGVDVPRDVSLIGYDDSAAARLAHIDLTTIAQDTAMMAEVTVRNVVGRLEGNTDEPTELVLPPKLVRRSTTAPPRG